MKLALIEKLITPLLRINARLKIGKNAINFFDVIAEARSILIVMPTKLEDFGIARNYLAEIKGIFPNARILLILRDQYRNLLNNSNEYGTIFVTHRNINFLGMPKKELLQKVSAANYDIAIDLNHNFHLLSTYLVLKSGAVLRVCLGHREREPYYNFSFRYSVGEQLDVMYRKLFKYLNAYIKEPVTNS